MKNLIVAILCLLTLSTASAFQPRNGHYWNPFESGRGYNIDVQDGIIILIVYAYDGAGNGQWYLASGPMTNSQRNFTGTLDKYRGGQCITCPYAGSPTLVGNDGTVSIVFHTETSATITFPGGRTTLIEPFNFGFGAPPQGLIGEWHFITQISSTFVDRYDLTTVLPASANGSGVVADLPQRLACELQTSGPFAGLVLCLDIDSTGATVSVFVFRFGLDETFDGYWQLLTSNNQWPMKGFKTRSRGGFARNATAAAPLTPMFNDNRRQLDALYHGSAGSPDTALQEAAQAILNVVRQSSTLR